MLPIPGADAAITTVAALLLSFDPPPTGYAVQVGLFDKPETKANFTAKLQEYGWNNFYELPAESQQFPGSRRLVVGRHPTYADAEWERLALRRRGFPDAFITTATTTQPWSDWRVDGPDTSVFGRPADGPKTREEAVQKDLGELKSVSQSLRLQAEPLSTVTGFPARHRLNGLRGDVRRSPELGAAQVDVSKVADADIRELATDAHRLKAPNKEENAVLVARLMPLTKERPGATRREIALARLAAARMEQHYRLRKLTAYRAYFETLDYCATDPELDDIARHARIGLVASLLETSLGKYPNADIRRTAAHVIGTNDRHIDARIMMYAAATLSHDYRYADGNRALDAVIATYPDQNGPLANALFFKGINHQYSGKTDKAVDFYEQAIGVPVNRASVSVYRNKPITAQHLATKHYQQILGNENPNETKKLSKILEDLDADLLTFTQELANDEKGSE